MTKKRVLIIISIIILLIIAVVAGFIGYLQLSLFEVEPIERNALTNYVNNRGLDLLSRKQDSLYEGEIPIEVLEDEAIMLFINNEKTIDMEIVNASIDLINGEAKVNYLTGNFYIPVYYQTDYAINDNQLVITMKSLSYGKNQINLPEFIDQKFFNQIFTEDKVVKLNIEDYNTSEIFKYDSSRIENDSLFVMLKLVLPDLDKLAAGIFENLNEDYIEVFENGSQEQKEALNWINEYEETKPEITARIFEDFLDKGKIIKNILVLATPDKLMNVYTEYPIIQAKVSKEEVLKLRGELIGEAVVGYGQYILEALKTLSSEGNLIISKGYPFDYENFETITIEVLIDRYDINIPEAVLNNMSMAYLNSNIYIAYQSEEGTFIAIDQMGYKIITAEQFKNQYNIPIPKTGELTVSEEIYEDIYDALFTYFGEDVFIRYLKDDGDEAYSIISVESDYQEYKLVALKKLGDVFEVYADGFESALELNKIHPDFNMNLVTRMNEGTQLLFLNSKTKNNLIDGLKEKGYMESGETLVYCSYDGVRYISLVLNSGEEYIYTIYRGTFLEDIYTLEDALIRFGDIDPMIILHANPSNDLLNE